MILVSLLVVSIFFVAGGNAFAPTRSNVNVVRRMEELNMVNIPLLGRFRKKKDIPMKPIRIGDILPEVDIVVSSNGVTEPAAITQLLGGEGGIKLLVGMPGAYTPTCSSIHLPGYRNYAAKLANLGVDKIAIVTTNDRFVNDAWAKEMGIIDKTTTSTTSTTDSKDGGSIIAMLSDGDSELVKKLGLVEDMGFGVGVRSKRFVLIIQEGVVTHIEIDEGLDSCQNTSAENIVNILTPPPSEVVESEMDMNLVIVGGGAFLLVALFFLLSQGGGGGDASGAPAAASATVRKAPEAIQAIKATDGGTENFLLLKQYLK
jgi:peroxiredoxin